MKLTLREWQEVVPAIQIVLKSKVRPLKRSYVLGRQLAEVKKKLDTVDDQRKIIFEGVNEGDAESVSAAIEEYNELLAVEEEIEITPIPLSFIKAEEMEPMVFMNAYFLFIDDLPEVEDVENET